MSILAISTALLAPPAQLIDLQRRRAWCAHIKVATLGCRYNFHPGSTCGKWSTEEGIAQIAALVNRALAATSGVTIVLENTAGQGSCIGHRFEQLADIIHQVK